MESWFGRWKKISIRFVGDVFPGSIDPDQFIDFIVIGADIVVADGPIVSFSIEILSLKVQWTKTKRNPSPVVGASSQHVSTEPIKLGITFTRIRFSFDFPITVCHIHIPESTGRRARTPPGRFVIPLELGLGFGICRVKIGASLK